MRDVMRELHERLRAAASQHAVRGEHDGDQQAAADVEKERNGPQLAELQPRAEVAAIQACDRNQKVLGEELGLAHDDENEADPEGDRTRDPSAAAADRRRSECVRCDTERDVEAANERSGRKLDERTREPTASLLSGRLVDLLR